MHNFDERPHSTPSPRPTAVCYAGPPSPGTASATPSLPLPRPTPVSTLGVRLERHPIFSVSNAAPSPPSRTPPHLLRSSAQPLLIKLGKNDDHSCAGDQEWQPHGSGQGHAW
ncbi:hypothetical protein ACS0TY_004357 [Phlomoides rotata]